ncbi:hypothetical protein [Nocardia amamiensis]|uniref:hypothetical protein n=1 Tax=Nocardia amamiensis TaxID=404578 RepID=UPI0033D31DF8
MSALGEGDSLRDLMAPGTVVDSALLQGSELIPHAGSGFRLVYRTTGQSEEPVISGAWSACLREAAARWLAVVSWGHGTSGMTEGCTPSRNNGAVGPVDQALDLSRSHGAGYAVAASDYVGSARLATTTALVPELSASYVASGLSQGGHAALFAGSMATEYAPELDLRAVLAFRPHRTSSDCSG